MHSTWAENPTSDALRCRYIRVLRHFSVSTRGSPLVRLPLGLPQTPAHGLAVQFQHDVQSPESTPPRLSPATNLLPPVPSDQLDLPEHLTLAVDSRRCRRHLLLPSVVEVRSFQLTTTGDYWVTGDSKGGGVAHQRSSDGLQAVGDGATTVAPAERGEAAPLVARRRPIRRWRDRGTGADGNGGSEGRCLDSRREAGSTTFDNTSIEGNNGRSTPWRSASQSVNWKPGPACSQVNTTRRRRATRGSSSNPDGVGVAKRTPYGSQLMRGSFLRT